MLTGLCPALMAAPYQPSLLRLLHGFTAVLALLAWLSGLLLFMGFDGRLLRLPGVVDGEWILRHGQIGALLSGLLLLFMPVALRLGWRALRRPTNVLPLLALLLAVLSGRQMEPAWLLDHGQLAPVYGLHLLAWLLLLLAVPLHLLAIRRRGGRPLALSMLSLRLRGGDGPAQWPRQLLRPLGGRS